MTVPNANVPLTKRLTPTPDGGLQENDHVWSPGSKTIQERTLELLNDGFALVDTRVDGTRLFERRKASTSTTY